MQKGQSPHQRTQDGPFSFAALLEARAFPSRAGCFRCRIVEGIEATRTGLSERGRISKSPLDAFADGIRQARDVPQGCSALLVRDRDASQGVEHRKGAVEVVGLASL